MGDMRGDLFEVVDPQIGFCDSLPSVSPENNMVSMNLITPECIARSTVGGFLSLGKLCIMFPINWHIPLAV